jgi:hypothetical protein
LGYKSMAMREILTFPNLHVIKFTIFRHISSRGYKKRPRHRAPNRISGFACCFARHPTPPPWAMRGVKAWKTRPNGSPSRSRVRSRHLGGSKYVDTLVVRTRPISAPAQPSSLRNLAGAGAGPRGDPARHTQAYFTSPGCGAPLRVRRGFVSPRESGVWLS